MPKSHHQAMLELNHARWSARAFELRLKGLTIRAIRDELAKEGLCDVTPAAVGKALAKHLEDIRDERAETVELVRAMEVERLDAMLAAIRDRVDSGDDAAIDRALKIMERRSRLLGLDAPAKTQTEVDGKIAVDRVVREIVYPKDGEG